MAARLSKEKTARIYELRAEGYSCGQVAAMVGCSPESVRRRVPGTIGKVPIGPLREAFLRSSLTAADVARSLGWWASGYADSSRVKRTLGLLPDNKGHGHHYPRTLVDIETISLIADAIGVAPWSVLPDEDTAPTVCSVRSACNSEAA